LSAPAANRSATWGDLSAGEPELCHRRHRDAGGVGDVHLPGGGEGERAGQRAPELLLDADARLGEFDLRVRDLSRGVAERFPGRHRGVVELPHLARGRMRQGLQLRHLRAELGRRLHHDDEAGGGGRADARAQPDFPTPTASCAPSRLLLLLFFGQRRRSPASPSSRGSSPDAACFIPRDEVEDLRFEGEGYGAVRHDGCTPVVVARFRL
jgi:hypothetical protein